jgi:hypothetical protein
MLQAGGRLFHPLTDAEEQLSHIAAVHCPARPSRVLRFIEILWPRPGRSCTASRCSAFALIFFDCFVAVGPIRRRSRCANSARPMVLTPHQPPVERPEPLVGPLPHVLGSGRERLQEVGRAVQPHAELLDAAGGQAPGGPMLRLVPQAMTAPAQETATAEQHPAGPPHRGQANQRRRPPNRAGWDRNRARHAVGEGFRSCSFDCWRGHSLAMAYVSRPLPMAVRACARCAASCHFHRCLPQPGVRATVPPSQCSSIPRCPCPGAPAGPATITCVLHMRLGTKGARARHEHIEGHLHHAPKVHAWLDPSCAAGSPLRFTID